jgi:hypothetical protein
LELVEHHVQALWVYGGGVGKTVKSIKDLDASRTKLNNIVDFLALMKKRASKSA